jgi:hypothetical protein
LNPWDEHAEEHGWEGRLKGLDPASQVSVAAACLERSLPLYLGWANTYDPETGRVAEEGRQLLWRFAQGDEDRSRGRVYTKLCDNDPENSDAPLDDASPSGWEALRLAVESTLQEDSSDLIESSMEASFHAVDRPLIQQVTYSDSAQLNAQLAADARVKNEIAFQEAVLSEVETMGRPLTRDRALEISAKHRDGVGDHTFDRGHDHGI